MMADQQAEVVVDASPEVAPAVKATPDQEVVADPLSEISTDALLEAAEFRLKEFQDGPCSRPDVANALTHVRVARSFMKRHADRVARIADEAAKLSQQTGTK